MNLQRKERQRQLQACELPVWDSSGASTVGRGTSALSPLSPALPRGAQAVLLSIAGAAWGSQGATLPWRQQDGVTPRNGAQPSQPLPALTAEHPSCHRCPKFLSSHEPPPAAILGPVGTSSPRSASVSTIILLSPLRQGLNPLYRYLIIQDLSSWVCGMRSTAELVPSPFLPVCLGCSIPVTNSQGHS